MNCIVWFIKHSNNTTKYHKFLQALFVWAIDYTWNILTISSMIIAEDQKRFLKFRNGANFEGQKNADENSCIFVTLHTIHFWWLCNHVVNCSQLVTFGLVVLELKRFDVNRSVFIRIELIWAGSVLFLVLVISCWLWHSVE